MALTFPLQLSEFFSLLPIQSAQPDLDEALDYSETGAGEIITASLGTRLWSMAVAVRPGEYDDMEAIKARINVLRYPGRSFLVHAIPSVGPRYDKAGAVLGASVVRLKSVSPNNRDVVLSGLPAGYVLSGGDKFSFVYGSNPVRYAMHEIFIGGVANDDGDCAVEVSNFIRSGYVINSVVELIKPVFKAVIVPASTKAGTVAATKTTGVSFTLRQTLR